MALVLCFATKRQYKSVGRWTNRLAKNRDVRSTVWTEHLVPKRLPDPDRDPSVSALIHWQTGEKEPWCLATNLPDASLTLRYYRRRMWTEGMFADFKKHGFDLENTMLRNPPRLSRLTLAVAFLYVWSLSVGSRTIRAGLRHFVDRKDRRDLSIFQIGLRFMNRRLLNSLPVSLPLCSR